MVCEASPLQLTRGCLHRSCKLLPVRLLHCDPSCWPSSADMVGAVASHPPTRTLSTIWLPLRCVAQLTVSAKCVRGLDRRGVDGRARSSFRASHALRGGKFSCGLLSLRSATASGSTPRRGSSPRLIAIMRGTLSGGPLVAWGSRALTAWYEGVGIRGLQTATNTDLKAVLAEKIPAQQVMLGTTVALHGCNRTATPPRPSCITFVVP